MTFNYYLFTILGSDISGFFNFSNNDSEGFLIDGVAIVFFLVHGFN